MGREVARPERRAVRERGESRVVDDPGTVVVPEPGLSQDHPRGHEDVRDAGDADRSQNGSDGIQLQLHDSDRPAEPAGVSSQGAAKDMTWDESVSLPEIGALVRCKTSLLRSQKRTSGRVKAILPQDYGPTVVIESVWGDEVIVTASEYSRFFEECDPRDLAREYWEST